MDRPISHQNDTSALRAIVVPNWVNSPNVRGTMDILQSCLLTLVACIYTALHLNVPEKTAWYQILWSKTQWVALTLFAPEIVLYMLPTRYSGLGRFGASSATFRVGVIQ